MKVLFLDDAAERQRTFKRRTIGCNLFIASTYEQCIHILQTESPFDYVFLDHDLSEAAAAGKAHHSEKTGTDVARFIAGLTEDKKPKRAIIHSLNPPGRERMKDILSSAGIPTDTVPGAWDTVSFS